MLPRPCELAEVVSQDEGVVGPGQAPGDSAHHTHGLGDEVLLCVGGRREDDMIGHGQEEAEAAGLPQQALRTEHAQPAEGPGPTVALEVQHILEEVCLWVAVLEVREVAEAWVGVSVRPHKGGEEAHSLAPRWVLLGAQALLHRGNHGRQHKVLEGLLVCTYITEFMRVTSLYQPELTVDGDAHNQVADVIGGSITYGHVCALKQTSKQTKGKQKMLLSVNLQKIEKGGVTDGCD